MPGDKKWKLFIPYIGKDPKKAEESSEEFSNLQKENNITENQEKSSEHKLIDTAMTFNEFYKKQFKGDSLFSIKTDKKNGIYEIVLNQDELDKCNLFQTEEEIGPETPEQKKNREDKTKIAQFLFDAPVRTKNPLEMAQSITKGLAELKKLSTDKPETKQ